MKKLFAIVILIVLNSNCLFSQLKFEKVVYVDNIAETDEMSVIGKDALSTAELTKFNLKIVNKGENIILYKPEESELLFNEKSFTPNEKPLEVAPTKTDHRVVDIKGTEFRVNAYSYEITGLYKVSTTDKALETADFKLPPSNNQFKTGDFSCTLLDLSKTTAKTTVKFECLYTGSKVGVIHPGRAAVRLPDGTEIANGKSKSSPILLEKGEKKKITLHWDRMQGGKENDMQKVNLQIVWRDTFVEADMIKLPPVRLEFKIDEAKSK